MWNRRKFGLQRGTAGAQELYGNTQGCESQGRGLSQDWGRGASQPVGIQRQDASLEALSSSLFSLLNDVEELEAQVREVKESIRGKGTKMSNLRKELLSRQETYASCLTNTLKERLHAALPAGTSSTGSPSVTAGHSVTVFQEQFQEHLDLSQASDTSDETTDGLDLFSDMMMM